MIEQHTTRMEVLSDEEQPFEGLVVFQNDEDQEETEQYHMDISIWYEMGEPEEIDVKVTPVPGPTPVSGIQVSTLPHE